MVSIFDRVALTIEAAWIGDETQGMFQIILHEFATTSYGRDDDDLTFL
jgi:hypothetical protein